MTATNPSGENRRGPAAAKRARFGLLRRHIAAVSIVLLISLPVLWSLRELLPLLV